MADIFSTASKNDRGGRSRARFLRRADIYTFTYVAISTYNLQNCNLCGRVVKVFVSIQLFVASKTDTYSPSSVVAKKAPRHLAKT